MRVVIYHFTGIARPLATPLLKYFLGVAGGTIERFDYSPCYAKTERNYPGNSAFRVRGRKAASRGDRKRERSCSGLSQATRPDVRS